MKKFFSFCLALLLCVTALQAFLCGADFAGALTQQPAVNTHLTAPLAVAADGGNAAVADEYGKGTKIHIFSDTELVSFDLTGSVKKMRLSGSMLFILQTDKFIIYDLQNKSQTEVLPEGSGAVTSFDVEGPTLYFSFNSPSESIDRGRIRRVPISTLLTENKIDTNNSGSFSLYSGELLDVAVTSAKLQAIAVSGGIAKCIKRNIDFSEDGDPAEAESNSKITAAGGDFWIWQKNASSINANGKTETILFKGEPLLIADAAYDASERKLYIVSDGKNRVVCQYSYNKEDGFSQTGVVLGSNGKDFEIPFNGALKGKEDFRLAKVASGSVYAYFPEKLNLQENGFTEADGFNGMLTQGQILMAFGEPVNGFYFVWKKDDGKFSFVDENALDFSDSTLITAHQTPLTRITAGAGYRFYSLPVETNAFAKLSLPKDAEILVLAELNGTDFSGWDFVSLENAGKTLFGFMRSNTLAVPDNTPPPPVLEQYKANPPVLQTLKVYSDADENSAVIAEVASGNTVYVFAGEKGEKWAKVEIKIDGENTVGFVLSSQLIESGLTNTFAAGLVTVIGVVLLLTLLAVVNKRRKKHTRNQTENPHMYSELERLD